MLILSRRRNEELLIGNKLIAVKVLEIRSGRVRLGITAPSDVSIRRIELNEEAVAPEGELVAGRAS